MKYVIMLQDLVLKAHSARFPPHTMAFIAAGLAGGIVHPPAGIFLFVHMVTAWIIYIGFALYLVSVLYIKTLPRERFRDFKNYTDD